MTPSPVLVVEDDRSTREIVCALLEGAGYTVNVAHNGRDALTLLDKIVPCVILTDLMMPVMGGLQLIAALRTRKQLAAVPVVLITGAEDALPPRAQAAFDRCLQKPVSPAKLLDLVAEFAFRARFARDIMAKRL